MIRALALALSIVLSAAAQTTISAKPGQITDVEGDVSLDGAPLGLRDCRRSMPARR